MNTVCHPRRIRHQNCAACTRKSNHASFFRHAGWGESFHFAHRYPDETREASIVRHEHYLAAQLGLKEGMRVVDLGCGVGGPARNIAKFSGAHITGLNNNEYQVGRATSKTAKQGLSDKVQFVKVGACCSPLQCLMELVMIASMCETLSF